MLPACQQSHDSRKVYSQPSYRHDKCSENKLVLPVTSKVI